MQRRTVVAIAAAVAVSGTVLAFTLPSMAETTPQSGAAPTSDPDAMSPQLLTAMTRDLHVTADQATVAVKRAQWASGMTNTLRTEVGAAYGGAWLTDGGVTLTVAVTDAAMADRVRAAGAVPKLVAHSAASLDGAKQALDRAAGTTRVQGVPGWYVDVSANKVALQALPGAAVHARQLAQAAGIPADRVEVVTVTSAPKPLIDVIGAQPYFISLAEGTARCSIGFAVKGGFITAGHCGKPGDKTSDFRQQPAGQVAASVFPGDADMGVVAVNAGATPQPFVDDFRGHALPVAGSTEAPIGSVVCRSGSTTGTHCGTILAKDQTVNYPEGQVTGLTRTNACAEAGDSGGPWLTGDQAQGVTSGGSGDCTVGGETFFQPVNEILQRNHVTLLTESNQQGGNQQGSGGGTAPGAGNGSTPPSAGDGSTPPSAGDGSTPPSAGDGSTPPSAGDGSTPPSAGDGSSTPPVNGAGRQGPYSSRMLIFN